MASVLPERPDLDQLRRQAKELRAAAVSGNRRAIARLRKYGDDFTLGTAQLAVARRYGFASWPRLNLEVRRKQLIARGDLAGLRELLTAHPELAVESVSSSVSRKKSSALEYVAVARFHGALDHDAAGALARVLLDAGAPVNGPKGHNESPLITAASYGELDMVRALLDAGADLEIPGHAVAGGTALAHAVEYGNPDVLDLLVAAGAKVHGLVEAAGVGRVEPSALATSTPDERAAALRAAAVCERLDVIDQLVAAGVDVNTEIDGGTALHWAAWHAKPRGIERLLALGADPDRHDPQHDLTPLGWYRFRRDQLAGVNNPGHLAVAEAIERLLGPMTRG
jgi:uncharacterized protein